VSESIMRLALKHSVNDVLEKMFFVQTLGELPCSKPPGFDPAQEIAARLTFEGEPAGILLIRLTSGAARQIAADFLGADEEEVSDLRVSEVVCELANMICGSVLSRVESTTVFRLSTPQIVPPSEIPEAGPTTTLYGVELSNGGLAVSVTTGSEA
jgi:CheY-specific phosphatase CheX